jgi:hypothetical protein
MGKSGISLQRINQSFFPSHVAELRDVPFKHCMITVCCIVTELFYICLF